MYKTVPQPEVNLNTANYDEFIKNTKLMNSTYEDLKRASKNDTKPYYGKKPFNNKYSRYKDIDTNERTTIDNITTNGPRDKFNANYINLNPYYNNTQYIAATCPYTSEVMNALIKQSEIKHVVMVTGIVENGKKKCTNYLDAYDNDNHTNIISNEKIIGEIRTISNIDNHIYTHYWFKAWPDHGVPANTDEFVKFLNEVRDKAGEEPLLVHCSAGVGRTGTFIILDYIINLREDKERPPTIHEINKLILKLRSQRNIHMVQALAQYEFIFNVLNDYYNSSKSDELTSQKTRKLATQRKISKRRSLTNNSMSMSLSGNSSNNNIFLNSNLSGTISSAKKNIESVIALLELYLQNEIRLISSFKIKKDKKKLEKTLKATSNETKWKIPKYLSEVDELIKDEVSKIEISRINSDLYFGYMNSIFDKVITELENIKSSYITKHIVNYKSLFATKFCAYVLYLILKRVIYEDQITEYNKIYKGISTLNVNVYEEKITDEIFLNFLKKIPSFIDTLQNYLFSLEINSSTAGGGYKKYTKKATKTSKKTHTKKMKKMGKAESKTKKAKRSHYRK